MRPQLLLIALCSACTNDGNTPAPIDEPVAQFEDVAAQTGLHFVHDAGAGGEYFFPEINGAGGALVDYDGDGDLDVYVVQGGRLDGAGSKGNRLFRNDIVPGGQLRFEDVTDESGGGDTGYGMGVATGDYDNDGDADLYVVNYGANVLYRNDAGVFTDVTAASGTGDSRWSAGASFADYDHDGDLDLYVVNYVAYSTDKDIPCSDSAGQRDYCSPSNYAAASDSLFRNNGDGSFTDVSKSAGIAAVAGAGLGVSAADFDGDGASDFFIANDQQANHLWINGGDGRFREAGLVSGSAYNGAGAAEASMGVAAGDFDGDGDDDLFLTHLTSQSNTLYTNDGSGQFDDTTNAANLGASSLRFTGFGAAWFDADNDGLLDLFVANGAVMILPGKRGKSTFPYEQRNQLFRNNGRGFDDVSAAAGGALGLSEVSRGAAFGDVDNDGDVDILVINNSGPVRLLRNELDNRNGWLRIRLAGTEASRDAQGARVALQFDDGSVRWGRAHSDGSYASASDVRVHFGLGPTRQVNAVMVVWPVGTAESWQGIDARNEVRLTQGTGSPLEAMEFGLR